jgi:hypothetical protein
MGAPWRIPPLIERTFVFLAVSSSVFATATMSPSPTNAIAVGPSRSAVRLSSPACSAARFVSVFLTTVKRAPCSRIFVRTSSSSVTERPR